MDFKKKIFDLSKKGGKYLASGAWEHKKEIAQALGAGTAMFAGMVKQSVSMVGNAISYPVFTDDKSEKMRERIVEQSREYSRLLRDKDARDVIMVGGFTLGELMSQKIDIPADLETAFGRAFPELAAKQSLQQALLEAYGTDGTDVNYAFHLAYPHLAAEQTLTEAVQGDSLFEIGGLISGIKGKLFEIKYVDYLNNGNLPLGYRAELADSPTQPGWDVRIVDGAGNVQEKLQLKATDSLEYIQNALERYPNIDVVVPQETFHQIALHGHSLMTDVQDSGLSLEEINRQVESYIAHIRSAGASADGLSDNAFDKAMDKATDALPHIDIGLPILSLALIAFSEYNDHASNVYQKSYSFGSRAVKAYASYLAGAAVVAALPPFFWFMGIPAAMAVRGFLRTGEKRRDVYVDLWKQYTANGKILHRLKRASIYKAVHQLRYGTWHNMFRKFSEKNS